jgi:glycosyltransferase involved in cell wall biosynthesis
MLNTVNQTPRVSVAMSFRDSSATLAAAVQSILTQTYQDFELLLCDDNSSDDSLAIASSFAGPRVFVWSDGLHKGLGARLNECIGRARGEYFVRMDADDISYPARIQKEVDFLDARPEIDVVGTYAMVFKDGGEVLGKVMGPTEHAAIVRHPLRNFPLWHPTWAGRTAWFQKHRYNAAAPPVEDQEILYRAYPTSRFAVIPEILLGYRQNGLYVKKIFKMRRYWWRAVGWHLHGFSGFLKRIQLAGILSVKVTVECAAIWTGLKYRVLRHRGHPMTKQEISAWQDVWHSLSSEPTYSTRT